MPLIRVGDPDMASKPGFNPYLALVSGIAAVSTGAIFARLADSPALVTAAYRVGLSTLVILPFALWKIRDELVGLSTGKLKMAVLAGFFLALHFATWISSLDYTTVANSVVLVNTHPIWVGLLSPMIARERIGTPTIAGITLSIMGGAIIGAGDLTAPGQALRGDLLALAGGGCAAFYLLIALRRYLRDKHFWQTRPEPNLKDMCDLVSIGTIADMVPLLQENRILTRMGLTVIDKGQRPGIKALMGTSGAARREINAEDIAFKLAPRLNAAGRMAHAETAFTLLSLRGTKKATAVAQALTELNTRRQQVEKAMFNGIMKTLEENPPLLRPHGLVLADPDWHEGVLGIVASRLAKRYFRPVVLISLKHGMGKGSGRSVPGVDLVRVLSMCADDLDTFGGHAMAAGLSVSPDNVPQFQKHFDKAVAATSGSDPFTPLIAIDCRLDFKTITDGIIDQLDILQPFGTGNPEPLFMTQNVIVTDSKIVGGNHRRMRLTQTSDKTGVSFNAIQFNVDTTKPLPLKFNRIAYRLRWNRWNGTKSPQLMVEETEIHPA